MNKSISKFKTFFIFTYLEIHPARGAEAMH